MEHNDCVVTAQFSIDTDKKGSFLSPPSLLSRGQHLEKGSVKTSVSVMKKPILMVL